MRGNPLRFVRWEPALRAMYHGRPVYDAARVDLHGLDPTATFTMADVAEQRRHDARLPRHVRLPARARRVHAEEIAGFLEDARVVGDEAREGDKMSWWGRDARGDTVLCRVLRAATRPRLRALHSDPRVLAIADLAPQPVSAKRKTTTTASPCCGSGPT